MRRSYQLRTRGWCWCLLAAFSFVDSWQSQRGIKIALEELAKLGVDFVLYPIRAPSGWEHTRRLVTGNHHRIRRAEECMNVHF